MAKKVRISRQPDLSGMPSVNFDKSSADATIYQKGIPVIVEKAYACPCRSKGSDSPLPSCRNCGGSGFVFVNPTEYRIVVSSINRTYKGRVQWSEELSGTMSVTASADTRLAIMDKLTLPLSMSVYNQIIHMQMHPDDNRFGYGYLAYAPINIESVFMFSSADEKLIRVDNYSIDGNIMLIEGSSDKAVSIRYTHSPQYLIMDIIHDIRDTVVGDDYKNMPISALAKKLHYVMDSSNINGKSLIDNSYQDTNTVGSCQT